MTSDTEQRLDRLESVVESQQETIDEQQAIIERLRQQLEEAGQPAPSSDADNRPAATDTVATTTASSTYKVLGELDADSGAGVLGKNTADSGTPIGVEGAVPNNSSGYGLSTPHDANVGGVLETSSLAGSLTGGTQVTDLIGAGLSVDGGALGLPTSGSDGQILKWDSAAVAWVLADDESSSAGAGDGLSVDGSGDHQINAGDGLSINSDSLDVGAGDGLIIDGNSVALDQSGATGEILKYDGAGWYLAADDDTQAGAGAGLSFDGSGNHQVNAGDGLSINSDSLDVGAGDGLIIDGNSVALDQSGLAGQILKYDGTRWYLAADDDTDTRTDVSDNGTTVVTDTSDINFQSSFTVTDDADNTVSVDLKNDSITITPGNGLTSGGTTALGGSTTIDVQPLGAEVYLSSDEEYSNTGNWTTVDFDTEVADDFDYFDTNNSRYEIPTNGDYDVDVDLNLWGLSGGTLLEARVFSPSLNADLMYTATATPESSESISLSKVLKQLDAGTTLEVQLKYDGTGALDGGSRDRTTWSINKVA